MKPLGLISQIGAIGLAIAIVSLIVRPTFAEIGDLQTQVQEYAVERERVTETNRILAARVSDLESVAVNDRDRLATYMPTLLDEVAVLRDIEIIAQNAGVNYTVIQYSGERVDGSAEARLSQTGDGRSAGTAVPQAHEFAVSVDGSYGRLKDFFSMLEQNQYPLQIHTLEVTGADGVFLSADAVVVTYITSASIETE